MKLRNKLLVSLLAALLAASLQTAPAWWGVLFPPVTHRLTTQYTVQCEEQPELRLKSLELLFSLFQRR